VLGSPAPLDELAFSARASRVPALLDGVGAATQGMPRATEATPGEAQDNREREGRLWAACRRSD